MIGEIMNGLIDKQKAIKTTIENTIEDVAEELKCNPKELFIMIKPTGLNDFNFIIYLYHVKVQGSPELVRKMELKEFTE